QHLSIDFGSVHGGASFEQEFSFFCSTFQQQVELLAYQGLLLPLADAALDLHQTLLASLDLARGDFFPKVKCACTFLVGIPEGSHPVKLCLADEVAQLFKFLLSFARKSNNKRRAQRNSWNCVPHSFYAAQEQACAAAALHALERARGCMLQRDVNVGTNLGVRRYGVQQAPGDLVRISVEEPNRAQIVDLSQSFQQQR